MSDLGVLFTRPLWVDEWFTVLVASHRSPLDVIADLRHGADGGPSLYHLLVWALGRVTELTPVTLHTLSLVTMVAALALVYATLRRRFGFDASAVGALAVGANSQFATYAFEGRFYALWVLCCAFTAWSLGLASRRRNVVVAIAAALLTLSHWYGVVTLALIATAVVASHGRQFRDGLKRALPLGAGVLAFLLVAPLAAGQQAVLTTVSWVPDLAVGQVTGIAKLYWELPALNILLIAVLVGYKWTGPPLSGMLRAAKDQGVVGLLGLALMPVALLALSFIGRPSMIPRYALPTLLAWAPVVAFAMHVVGQLGRWARLAVGVFALAAVMSWQFNFQNEITGRRAFTSEIQRSSAAFERAKGLRVPIVFHSQYTMYPLTAASHGDGVAAVFLDLPDSTLDALFSPAQRFHQLNKGVRLERDFARVHNGLYGFPRLARQVTLDTTSRFVLLAREERIPRGMKDINELGRVLFPRHRATLISESLLLLEREAGRSPPARSTSR